MAITDARQDVMSEEVAGSGNQRFFVALLDRPAFRWGLLVLLGVLALPLYQRILQVAGSFDKQPGLLFWPLLGVTVIGVAACWLVFSSRPAGSRFGRWLELGLILVLGLMARALFFGAPPLLSHDAYRYVWDAHLLTHGVSPYLHSPFDPVVKPFEDQAIWPNLRFRNSPTIYPPGAEAMFLLIYWLKPLSMGALKAGIEVCDGLVAVLTMLLLRRHRLDTRRVLLYWWSPIPVLEFAFNAHLDAEVIVWTLAALLVAGMRWRGSWLVTGVLVGLGTLTKFYPALFALVMARRRRDWPLALGLVGTVLVGYLAFWKFQAQSGGFLSTYVNQSTFDRGALLGVINFFVMALGGSEFWVIALQFLALAGLSLLVGWFWWRTGLRMESGVLAINIVWILLSTHLFPWYIAVLLPLLALYLRLPATKPAVKTAPEGQRAAKSAFADWVRAMPSGEGGREQRQADLSGRYATPALGIWFFVLAMPFTYVYFASGAFHPMLFQYSFLIAFVLAVLPLLTRKGRVAFRAFLRRSFTPVSSGAVLVAPLEESSHAIDATQPSAGKPA
jgi:hypothetical protein